VKDRVAVVVDFFSLKPFWDSIDIMFLLQKILTCYTLTFPIFLKKSIKMILVYNSVHHIYPLFYKRVLRKLFSAGLEKCWILKKQYKSKVKAF